MTISSPDHAPAVALLDKVRTFADALPARERELFAVLIGPGVEALMAAPLPDDDDVTGPSHQSTRTWKPGSLRVSLATAATTTQWQLLDRR